MRVKIESSSSLFPSPSLAVQLAGQTKLPTGRVQKGTKCTSCATAHLGAGDRLWLTSVRSCALKSSYACALVYGLFLFFRDLLEALATFSTHGFLLAVLTVGVRASGSSSSETEAFRQICREEKRQERTFQKGQGKIPCLKCMWIVSRDLRK